MAKRTMFAMASAGFLVLAVSLTTVLFWQRIQSRGSSAGFGPALSTPGQTPAQTTHSISVDARRMWTDTGIRIKDGDSVTMDASGEVNGDYAPSHGFSRWVGPDGWNPPRALNPKSAWVLGEGSSYMCLTGRIGEGRPFKVGSHFSLKANGDGILYLGVNDEIVDEIGDRIGDDNSAWTNNAGSFQVTIKTATNSQSSDATVLLPKNDDGSYRLASTDEAWHQVGSGRFTIEVKGKIDFGGIVCGPEGVWRTGPGIEIALAPNLPLGAVIAKIGENGSPFVVGSFHEFDTKREIAYIAVNDTNYKDNSGTYTIYKKK